MRFRYLTNEGGFYKLKKAFVNGDNRFAPFILHHLIYNRYIWKKKVVGVYRYAKNIKRTDT